jgi:hypothetical protein
LRKHARQLGAVGVGKVRGCHAGNIGSRCATLNDPAAAAIWPGMPKKTAPIPLWLAAHEAAHVVTRIQLTAA